MFIYLHACIKILSPFSIYFIKRFNIISSLSYITDNQHQSLYNYEQRPFVCEICKKGFRDMNNLQSHKIIHRDRAYECKTCGKKFYKSSNLKSHEKTHSTEKLFDCNICGKSFALKTNLKSHFLLSHPKAFLNERQKF